MFEEFLEYKTDTNGLESILKQTSKSNARALAKNGFIIFFNLHEYESGNDFWGRIRDENELNNVKSLADENGYRIIYYRNVVYKGDKED